MHLYCKKAVATAAIVAGIGFFVGQHSEILISCAQAGTVKPMTASSLAIPITPIVSGTGDLGYLPGTGSVSPTGGYNYTIPIEVPAGRAGMAPALSLRYSSTGGNGMLGVGWALSGLSAISRCSQTLSTEGVVSGVHLTDFSTTPEAQRDRFCLDGRKLMAINGAYGADQTEYRTEQDTYQKIVSSSTTSAATTQGPDAFTVTLPNGTVRTFTAPSVTQWAATTNNIKSLQQVRALWLLSSETDVSGNGIVYNYTPTYSSDGQAVQVLLSSIDYTSFCAPGSGCSASTASGAYRHVTFSYESRPDQEFSWQAGLKAQLLQRLSAITLSAPDPVTTAPVWRYVLKYQPQPSSFSGRSLLSSVQRCALQGPSDKTPGALGSCTWAKTFSYSAGGSTPTFSVSTTPSATNVPIFPIVVAQGSSNMAADEYADQSKYPQPNVRVLDVNNDGADDVLFQAGPTGAYFDQLNTYNASQVCVPDPDTAPYESCTYSAPMPVSVAPLLLLGKQGTTQTAAPNPFTNSYDLATDYGGDYYIFNNAPPFQTNGWGALENLGLVDVDGNGQASLFMEAMTGPTGCSGRILNWGPRSGTLGWGMNDKGVSYPFPNCGQPALAQRSYMLLDMDGDTRPDFATASNIPNVGATDWQIALNEGANTLGPQSSAPSPLQTGISSGCPVYAVDLTGEGRTQIFGQTAGLLLNPTPATTTPGTVVACEDTATYTYSPFSGQYVLNVDNTGAMPDLTVGIPPVPSVANCLATHATPYCFWTVPTYKPIALYFGDFNGDGLNDVITANADGSVLALRWNTGNGFGPPVSLPAQPWTATSYKIVVADINQDGRADLVVFHDQPFRAITLLLSKGDGTFTTADIPGADPGVRTIEGWSTSTLGDFNGDGKPDIVDVLPGPLSTDSVGNLVIATGTLQTLIQNYGAISPGSLMLQPAADLLVAVQDESASLNRESVSYSGYWSDKPEDTVCSLLLYPQHCLTKGINVVRWVGSSDTWANSSVPSTHYVYYSYEEPAVDLRGRGFLGFRKVRVWDPTRLQQTITLYDNVNETGTLLPAPGNVDPFGPYVGAPVLFQAGYYAGQRPQSITTVTAIPSAATPQTLPVLPRVGSARVNARVEQVLFQDQLVRTHNGLTYVIEPTIGTASPAQVTSRWEQSVAMAGSVTDPADPTSDFIWGIQAPASMPWQHTSVVNTLDAYGNVLSSTDQTTSGATVGTRVQTTSIYNNFTTTPSWLLGQLTSRSVLVTDADSSVAPVTHRVDYGYYPNGLLQTQTRYQVTSGSASIFSTTTLGRDTFGNVTSTTVQATGPDGQPATRQVNTEYDPLWSSSQPDERIFPSQVWTPYTPAPGSLDWTPSKWALIHPAYGIAVATMDSNGVQSGITFDDQARPIKISPAVGASTTIGYQGRSDTALSGTNGMIVTRTSAGQTQRTFTDANARTLQRTHLAFDGTDTTESYITYDTLGRAITTSRPYSGTAVPTATSVPLARVVYDGLNRVVQQTSTDGAITTYASAFFTGTDTYAGGFQRNVSSQTTTDPLGNQSRTDTDMDGRVIATANLLTTGPGSPSWLTTMFHYIPFDHVDRVTLPSGAVETTHYDSLGRVTGHYSPDMGTTIKMNYDGFDELLGSVHQESGAQTTQTYDALGRLMSWRTVEGGSASTWAILTYDTQKYGLGKLATTSSSDNVATLHSYDQYGRPIQLKETIQGKPYTLGTIYDPQGRPSQQQYPAIGTNPNPGLTLQQNYNAYGYVFSLSDLIAPPTGTTTSAGQLLTILGRNPDGSLASATATNVGPSGMGNFSFSYLPLTGQLSEASYTSSANNQHLMDLNYTYFANGMVNSRTDTVNGRQETYINDSLNRLTNWNLSTCTPAPCIPAASTAPLTHIYGYDVDGNLTGVGEPSTSNPAVIVPIETNSYGPTSGSTGGGPHALTLHNVNAVSQNYNYDTHGRQTSGGGRTVTYNAFDLPRTVTQGSSTWSLKYDAFGNRVYKTGPDGSTVYVGGIYEQRIPVTGTPIVDVFKVPGLAQVQTDESSGSTTTEYLLTDPLGSTGSVIHGAMVSGVLNESVVSTFFYEPFGARIAKDGTLLTVTSPGDVHDGFTGQEHDDDFGLINFKGRAYDPILKRFMSTDPQVTHPRFGQNWNPYSYVLNNPLNFTDATGFGDDAPEPPSQQEIDARIPDGAEQIGIPFINSSPGDGGQIGWWEVNVKLSNTALIYVVISAAYAPSTPTVEAPGPVASTPSPSAAVNEKNAAINAQNVVNSAEANQFIANNARNISSAEKFETGADVVLAASVLFEAGATAYLGGGQAILQLGLGAVRAGGGTLLQGGTVGAAAAVFGAEIGGMGAAGAAGAVGAAGVVGGTAVAAEEELEALEYGGRGPGEIIREIVVVDGEAWYRSSGEANKLGGIQKPPGSWWRIWGIEEIGGPEINGKIYPFNRTPPGWVIKQLRDESGEFMSPITNPDLLGAKLKIVGTTPSPNAVNQWLKSKGVNPFISVWDSSDSTFPFGGQ